MEIPAVKKRWVLRSQPPEGRVEALRQYLKKGDRPLDATLAKLLLQRGVDEASAEAFFLPSLDKLHDPFAMKDMNRAVERLTEAVFGDERIMVLGDYDVDGTTAVAMLVDQLRKLGKDPLIHIPDRYEEGYGVSFLAVDRALEEGVGLLLTLDCGIKGHEAIARAEKGGVDVIICDHHRPDRELPEAHAVLDPQRSDDPYPFSGLSGCGVTFKLLQAFFLQQELDPQELYEYLDLLAISIAADIVPMIDENRVLTHFGLERIDKAPRPGVRELMRKAGTLEKRIDVTQLVFTIGPRINAAGRMDHGSSAVELLICGEEEAAKWGGLLDGQNQERRDLDKRITREALEELRADPRNGSAFTTIVHSREWHKGVVGIVASRLLEHYHRPTIVLTGSGEEVTGSARSVKGFDLHQALEACSSYLKRFGGHRHAAGMTLREKDVPNFKKAFEEEVAQSIDPTCLVPEFEVDAELPLGRIDARFFRTLHRFGPYGPGNPQPLFVSRNVLAESVEGVGKDKTHLRLRVYQEGDPAGRLQAIAFGSGDLYPRILEGEPFHILYHIEMNEFRGKKSIQLRIKDIGFGKASEVFSGPSSQKEKAAAPSGGQ